MDVDAILKAHEYCSRILLLTKTAINAGQSREIFDLLMGMDESLEEYFEVFEEKSE